MKIVKILRTTVCSIFLSEDDRSAARVFKVNPRLNRTRQINSFSRGVNCDSRPLIDFVALTDSPKFQWLIFSIGQTSFKKLHKTSNWEGVRPTKCFIKPGSSRITTKDKLLTIFDFWSFTVEASFFEIIFSTFADKIYFVNTVCVPSSNTIFPVTGLSQTGRVVALSSNLLFRGLKSLSSSHRSCSLTIFSLFAGINGSSLDKGAFLFNDTRLACAGLKFAFSGPFSPGQWRAHMYVFLVIFAFVKNCREHATIHLLHFSIS